MNLTVGNKRVLVQKRFNAPPHPAGCRAAINMHGGQIILFATFCSGLFLLTHLFFYEKFKNITIYCFRADSWYWPILRGCGWGGNCWVPTIGASFLTHQLLAAQLPTLGRKELGTTHCLELPTGQTRVALNWHTGGGGIGVHHLPTILLVACTFTFLLIQSKTVNQCMQ